MTTVTMLVPSRGRPGSVSEMADAWDETDPLHEARLVWVLDADDPRADEYRDELRIYPWMQFMWFPEWMPLVPKLNAAAVRAKGDVIGFMGDDHRPRSSGWAARLAAAHNDMGPGIFYGRDGLQDIKLPTWWAMSSVVVSALGRMVPADVEHLYCDNAVLELGKSARCIWFLSSVLIEHMHPVANKAEWDEGHLRVNSPEQYEVDRRHFLDWLMTSRVTQARELRRLRVPS